MCLPDLCVGLSHGRFDVLSRELDGMALYMLTFFFFFKEFCMESHVNDIG